MNKRDLYARMGNDWGDYADLIVDRAIASGTGLGSPKGPEPHPRLRASRAIPIAKGEK